MMGYLLLFAMVLCVTAGLWLVARLKGSSLTLVLAALMVGGAGYALQGQPFLPGSPTEPGQGAAPLQLTAAREAMLGQFNQASRWLRMADSFSSRGKTGDAVGILRAGLKGHPEDAGLWVGLGNALVDHAGMVTPAAEFAYERARTLAPKHPAPLFFRGLALARSGEREQALESWQQALALTPAGTTYRPMIEGGIAMLEGRAAPLPTMESPPAAR